MTGFRAYQREAQRSADHVTEAQEELLRTGSNSTQATPLSFFPRLFFQRVWPDILCLKPIRDARLMAPINSMRSLGLHRCSSQEEEGGEAHGTPLLRRAKSQADKEHWLQGYYCKLEIYD